MSRTIAALYDSRAEAELARDRLVSDLKAKSPRIFGKETAAAVDNLKISRSDAEKYRDGLRQGSLLLVAEVPSSTSSKRVIEVLEQSANHKMPVSADQVVAEKDGVRVEDPNAAAPPPMPASRGIAPVQVKRAMRAQPTPAFGAGAKAPPAPPPRSAEPRPQPAPPVRAKAKPQPAPPPRFDMNAEPAMAFEPPPAAAAPVRAPVEEERIPVVEEQLRVGKRQVARGGARVRATIRDAVAEEQVTLNDEIVDIETRPSGQRLSNEEVQAGGLLKDRVFEIVEMHEEAVVTKVPVVREEIVVRKTVREHQETIRDTVRQTVVEVEDLSDTEDDSPAFFGGPSSRGR